jgi:hypothetical protein
MGAVRRAALALSGPGSASHMTTAELLEQVKAQGDPFTASTVRSAISAHLCADDGVLLRVRAGVYQLRTEKGIPPVRRRGHCSDHLQAALVAAGGSSRRSISRAELESRLRAEGLRYSARAVTVGLARLVEDPSSGVRRGSQGRYFLDVRPAAP